MSSKVILLKYMARFCDAANLGLYLQQGLHCDKTAIILERTKDHFLSIQGYPEVPFSEKHKTWFIFQKAVKQLLGIPKDTAICIRFTDAPYRMVGSLSTLLMEPRYLIDLVVHPLHHISHASVTISTDLERHNSVAVRAKEPRYAFRGRHCNFSLNGMQSKGGVVPVREDWRGLYSKLSKINVYLQKTQKERNLVIADKCSDRKDASTSLVGHGYKDDSRVHEGIVKKRVENSVSFCSLSSNSESGKGSMLGSDTTREETEMDVATNRMLVQDSSLVKEVRTDLEEDARVEHLLGIAQGLAHQFDRRKVMQDLSAMSATHSSASHRKTHQRQSPDAPTDVIVRASFRHGGAYVMWNPVSVDSEGFNRGHKVLGYEVYLDQKLHCTVEGALTSQAEILGMEDGTEYAVQVCTKSEKCTSSKIAPVIHRHHETNQVLALKTQPIKSLKLAPASTGANQSKAIVTMPSSVPCLSSSLLPAHVSGSQVSKVHTWLKNKNLSDPHEIKSDRLTEGAHSSLNQTVPPRSSTSLHVHFMDDKLCSYADDAKSLSSSHTSGIVTDYLVSPKLLSSCLCRHCCSNKPMTMPSHESTPLSMPSVVHQRHNHHRPSSTIDVERSNKFCESSSKLLFKNRHQSSIVENNGTVIDQSLFLKADLEGHQSKRCSSTKDQVLQRRRMSAGRHFSKHDRMLKTKSCCVLLATYV